MARYHISHYPKHNTWLCKTGTQFYWYTGEDAHRKAHRFQNYKEARAALDTLPDEKLMYGESYKMKCHFMKSYDSAEHFKNEMESIRSRRLLRSWGY